MSGVGSSEGNADKRQAMALVKRKTEEEKAQDAAIKQQRRREDEARKRAEQIQRARRAFFATPAGQARLAYDRGDHVFQYAHDVMSQRAIIVAMVGSSTSSSTADPVAILNSVCREGGEIVNGSFVFVEQGQESRDKFMASGQNVAIKGVTVGYYVFKRCDANRAGVGDPWEDAAGREDDDDFVCVDCGGVVADADNACPHCGVDFSEDADPDADAP
jgi:hypothetical protein